MELRRVTLSTRNDHKLRELSEILDGFELLPLSPEVELPPETGTTFEANALIKARAARDALGGAVIADDSGIAAAALDGGPGVYSARYAGEHASDEQNLAKLFAELEGEEDRRVAYVCVMAYVDDSGRELTAEGRCEGAFLSKPRGEGGFGYDPGFVPDATGPDDQRTMAELSPEEKHAISHRGLAARALAELLEAELGGDVVAS